MACLNTWKDDCYIKYWGTYQQDNLAVDRSKVVGIMLPVYQCIHLIELAYSSLIRSMPMNYPFGLVAIDGGSTDGTRQFLEGQVPTIVMQQPCKGNQNAGVEMFLGKYDKATDKFEHEGRVGYIGFVHSDCDYDQEGWLGKLVEHCEANPDVGCAGPWHWHQHPPPPNLQPYTWNMPMWIIPVRVIKESYRRYGWWVDPAYWNGVAFEEWDFQWRFMWEMNLKSVIVPQSQVKHTWVGTRAALSRSAPWFANAERENREYYNNRWKTLDNPWAAHGLHEPIY